MTAEQASALCITLIFVYALAVLKPSSVSNALKVVVHCGAMQLREDMPTLCHRHHLRGLKALKLGALPTVRLRAAGLDPAPWAPSCVLGFFSF